METSVNNKCGAFTSLEQSRKLAEILPLESADMFYDGVQDLYKEKVYNIPIDGSSITVRTGHVITDKGIKANLLLPCWSLAALLDVLPILERKGYQKAKPRLLYNIAIKKWIVDSHVYTTDAYDNPVDACVAMIESLHELNLL